MLIKGNRNDKFIIVQCLCWFIHKFVNSHIENTIFSTLNLIDSMLILQQIYKQVCFYYLVIICVNNVFSKTQQFEIDLM